jgi:hypothetical protein
MKTPLPVSHSAFPHFLSILGGDRYGGGGGRGGGGRFDSDERRPRRERSEEEDMGPSRADTGDWGAKQFVPSGDRERGGFGGERGGGFGGDRGGFRDRDDRPPREFDDGPSRADTGDWGAKQFVPSSDRDRGAPGGGFRDRGDRDGGFRDRGDRDTFREPSRADVEDKWERKGGVDDSKPTGFDDRPRRTFDDQPPRERRGGFADSWRGRDRSVGSGPTSRDGSRDQWRREAPPSAANDDDAPRERPKLMLKPRTASADARAAAEEASRPSIFGAARPREEILKEQGRDAIQEDKRLEEAAKAAAAAKPRRERRERADTEEEAALKAKIEELKAKTQQSSGGGGEGEEEETKDEVSEEEKSNIAEEVAALEAELAKLKVEADEKAADASRGRGGARRERGGERRPGSGNGSVSGGDSKEKPAGEVRRDGGGFKKRDDTDANRW